MINLDPGNYKAENILSEENLIKRLEELRKQGKRIGLCTGSFDLLHPGHITHLESAKKVCDVLIVGIARDHFSSNKYPDSKRPIFSHDIRAFMVSKLKPVDFVFLDDGKMEVIELIRPDIYIKGSDYADEKEPNIVRVRKLMERLGGKSYYTKDEKLSTTDIIKHIKEEIK